jgi:hypothetical protein
MSINEFLCPYTAAAVLGGLFSLRQVSEQTELAVMKSIDTKSLLIGTLFTAVVFLVGCGGGEPRQASLPSRGDIWVSSITLNPDSKIKYVGKTRDLPITSISKVEEVGVLQKISVGDTVRGVRIGAIKCIFHEEDSSYGGKQYMWRGRWSCMAGRSKHEVENAVTDDGARYDYIHIAPVTLRTN